MTSSQQSTSSSSGSSSSGQSKKKNNNKNTTNKSSHHPTHQDDNNTTTTTTGKSKIRPTDSIFHRIHWDVSIPKDQVLIGYLDRFIGIVEVPFNKWKGVDEHEGVPMHRIRYFKLNGQIVWDREKKIDLLTGGTIGAGSDGIMGDAASLIVSSGSSGSGSSSGGGAKTFSTASSAPSARSSSSSRSAYPYLHQIPYYRYSHEMEQWEVIESTSHTRSVKLSHNSPLRILSYNILFDMHETDRIHTWKRIPHLLDIIRKSDADIVALQEVRRSFLNELCRDSFIQQHYFVSDVSGDATVGDAYGQVMLSKMEPNVLYLYRFSSMKFALLPLFLILPHDSFVKERLLVPIVHLSSDHTNNASSKRCQQLNQLFQQAKSLEADHTMIVGDFNFSDGEPEDELLHSWGKDAWLLTHKIQKHPGYTYDPSVNICAAITTKKNIPRRLDKVVYSSQRFAVQHTELLGLDSFAFTDEVTQKQIALHPSDHYALQCDFVLNGLPSDSVIDQLRRVHSSSLAIVPPKNSWKRIQKIRNMYDPAAKRWPPHINLIYPFFDKSDLDMVKPLIETRVKNSEPFIIRLESFEADENGVVYLKPCTRDFELLKLQESLQKLFPTCHNLSMIDSNYVPRLEVARFSTDEVSRRVAELQSNWEPVEFLVDQIYVIDREESTFNVEFSAPLGSNPTLKIEDISPLVLREFYSKYDLVENRDRSQQKKQALDYLEATIMTHFAPSEVLSTLSQKEYLIKTFGSHRLGIKSNDIDTVCICTSQAPSHSPSEFLESMKYILSDDTENVESCRSILDALVPMLSIRFVNGLDIDLLYVHLPVTLEDNDATLQKLNRAQLKIISGLKESGYLLRYVPDRKLFQSLISFVKYWAKQRGIYSNAFGYLGGISYAILCAYACRDFKGKGQESDNTLVELIKHFFSLFSKWKWPQSVALSDHRPKDGSKHKSPLPIYLPVYPYANSTRNVTSSTQKIIISELKRAHDLLFAQDDNASSLSSLLDKVVESSESQFASSYKKYISIQVSAGGDRLTFDKWFGWVRSRIIHLIVSLDQKKIATHVNPNAIEEQVNRNDCRSIQSTIRIGIVSDNYSEKVLEEELASFELLINGWEHRPEEFTSISHSIHGPTETEQQ